MGPPPTSLLSALLRADPEVFRVFARLNGCKHPPRLPSLSFGATTEYHRSDQPMSPLTRSRQPDCTRQTSQRLLRSAVLPPRILGFRLGPGTPKRSRLDSGQTHQPLRQQLPGRNQVAADTSVGFGAKSQTDARSAVRLPHADRGQRASTSCGNHFRVHATKVALLRMRPVHPLPPALTPARSRKAHVAPARLPNPPKCAWLTRTLGQARESAIVPQRGHGPNLNRPKVTETSKPSTTRWSCSALAVSSASKLVNGSSTQLKPKFRPGGRSSGDSDPKMPSWRTHTRESRSTARTPRGASVRTRDSCGRSEGQIRTTASGAEASLLVGDRRQPKLTRSPVS